MALTRRDFLARSAAAGAFAALAVAGCSRGGSAGAAAADAAWSAEQDDSLPILTTQVSGGNVVAMPGSAWYPMPEDGYIQLQLGGGSIPGVEIDSVTRDGKKLLVALKTHDGPQTMDLVLTEFRLEPQGPAAGTPEDIDSVTVDYGNEDVRTLEKAHSPAQPVAD